MPIKKLLISLAKFRKDESGASAIEYGLFAALIAAVIAVTVGELGKEVRDSLAEVKDAIVERE